MKNCNGARRGGGEPLGFVPALLRPAVARIQAQKRRNAAVSMAKGKRKKDAVRKKKSAPADAPSSAAQDLISPRMPAGNADRENGRAAETTQRSTASETESLSGLSPLVGSRQDEMIKAKKKNKDKEEPRAIKIAKISAWIGIGTLVAIELWVHLIVLGDWNPFRRA